jgi:uncharacterized protein HemX
MPKYVAIFVVLALAAGGFYFFGVYQNKTELAKPQPVTQQAVATNEKIPTPTPTIDLSNDSIDTDITALDRDLQNLQNEDASFSTQLKSL